MSNRKHLPPRLTPEHLQFAAAVGRCPDCDSHQRIRPAAPGVFELLVLHDDTCPRLARMERG